MQKPASQWTEAGFRKLLEEIESNLEERGDLVSEARTRSLVALLGRGDFARNGAVDEMQWRLALSILLLREQSKLATLSEREAKTIFEEATNILKTIGIKPSSSVFSFLYTELSLAYGKLVRLDGDPWTGAWYAELGRHALYKPDHAEEAKCILMAAEHYLRLGHASLALGALTQAKVLGIVDSSICWLECHALRLAGDRARARAASTRLSSSTPLTDAQALARDWELQWLELDGEAVEQVPAAAMSRFRGDQRYVLLLKLWAFAAKRRVNLGALPKASSVKRRTNGSRSKREIIVFQALEALEEAYDGIVPMFERLSRLGVLLGKRQELPTVEHELLFLAAVARFLLRHSQESMADLVLAEFQALCLKMSQGQSRDVLGIMRDVMEPRFASSERRTREEGDLVKSRWQRARALGGLATSSLQIAMSSRIRLSFAREHEKARIREMAFRKMGEEFYQSLGQLKGGVMKVGQLLSYAAPFADEFKLPLALLQAQAAPRPSREARDTVERELGMPIEQAFATWADEPVAVGSIGQVHRARLADGTLVAVKVQHPNMDVVIEEDIKALRFFQPLLRYVLPKADHEAIFCEVRDRLREEVDYENEAASQMAFREAFLDDPEIYVPSAIQTHSTRRVLTSEYVEGEAFADFTARANQDEKNRAAGIIVRQMCTAFFQFGMFNGDPQPANLIFLEDGRVAFIDFGCVRRWDRTFTDKWLRLATSVVLHDKAECKAAWQALGYDRGSKAFDYDEQFELSRQMLAPLATPGRFRFTPAYQDLLSRIHVSDNRNLRVSTPPPESALLVRIAWGLVGILTALDAEDDWHAKGAAALGLDESVIASARASG